MRVIVLGTDGMLGHKVYETFKKDADLSVFGTTRQLYRLDNDNHLLYLDAFQEQGHIPWYDFDYAINCIGVIKPHVNENNPMSVNAAIKLNSVFPQSLGNLSYDQCQDVKVIHASTDCVFNGDPTKKFIKQGYHQYIEANEPDALDVYGRTKILGECPHNMNLRTSIIGPQLTPRFGWSEVSSGKSLLEWFLGQEPNKVVDGYATHSWNGITTLQWAKNALTIIRDNLWAPGIFHTGKDMVDKAELLQLVKDAYLEHGIQTASINVRRDMAAHWMNLRTINSMFYAKLQMPSLRDQIKEMASDHVAQDRYSLRNPS
jgi:dTDP-4-dehydrorhamnose reductase